jgi:hypothetical protein
MFPTVTALSLRACGLQAPVALVMCLSVIRIAIIGPIRAASG